MFIQGRSIAFSLLTHILFFLFLFAYFSFVTPEIPLLPRKRVVSVSVGSLHSPVPAAPSAPLTPAPGKNPAAEEPAPVPQPSEERPPVSEPAPKERERISESSGERESRDATEAPAPAQPRAEVPAGAEAPDTGQAALSEKNPRSGEYSYSLSEQPSPVIPAEPAAVPVEDFSLDHLLIKDNAPQEGSDSLYSIELSRSRNREILSLPELVFDTEDPVIGTLSDCRISFTVTREGLVREIRMVPPGTGSETYDEILETLLSRFLFSPGDEDAGAIAIRFSRISGAGND